MNLLNFVDNFPDETNYKAKFRKYIEKQGVICPKCGNMEHYWKRDRVCYECKGSGKRQSLLANIVMYG
jgi:hypothetical protein